ncbi:hypothetical protein D3C72_2255310 [compost metagenome]
MPQSRQIARSVEAAAACLFEPGAGIARTGRGRAADAAAPIDMGAAEDGDFAFRHECSSVVSQANRIEAVHRLTACGALPKNLCRKA